MKNIFETLIARFDVISIRVQFIFLLIENVSLSLCEIDRISHRTNIKIKNARNRSILFQSINEQFTSFFVISSHFNFLLSFLLTSSATPLLAVTTCFIQHQFFLPVFLCHLEQTTQNRKLSNFLLAVSSCKWRGEIKRRGANVCRIYLVENKMRYREENPCSRIPRRGMVPWFQGPRKNKSSGAYDGVSTDDK